MNDLVSDLDVHEMREIKTPEWAGAANGLIVISGNINHIRALRGFARQFIKNFHDRIGAIPALVQLPPVDDIADEIEKFGVRRAQEVKERNGIESPGADVKIGEEERAEVPDVCFVLHGRQTAETLRTNVSVFYQSGKQKLMGGRAP